MLVTLHSLDAEMQAARLKRVFSVGCCKGGEHCKCSHLIKSRGYVVCQGQMLTPFCTLTTMQTGGSEDTTNVLIDLIGTEDNDEDRTDPVSFSLLHPGLNSALVAAQSTARPIATAGLSGSASSSANSSLRDRSGRFNYDRIREELTRAASVSKSHSDVTELSWTRSNSTQAGANRSMTENMPLNEPNSDFLEPVSLNKCCYIGLAWNHVHRQSY